MAKNELVFGYGSNMDLNQMHNRCPNSDLASFNAKAKGWKLCFPRTSSLRKGGVGSIVPSPCDETWGVVFSVDSQDLLRLDGFEGVNSGAYRRDFIEVFDSNDKPHKVWTYFAIPKDNPPKHYVPHKDYLDLYIQGADYFQLPKDYVQKLKTIATKKTDE